MGRRENIKIYKRERKEQNKIWLNQITKGYSCAVCGNPKIDWHHIYPSTKKFNISWEPGHSRETLLTELEKCAPLCRYCHTKYHAGSGHISMAELFLNRFTRSRSGNFTII